MKQKNLIRAVWVYIVALFVFAIGFHSEASSPTPTEKAIEQKSEKATEKKADKEKEKKKTNQKTEKKVGQEMFANFETNRGNFKVKLFNEQAPKTVENFVGLAEGTKE